MTRERRVRPAVSSASAARVCVDVGEAERGEPFLGGRHRERADSRERVEQWREEELLVDAAHDALDGRAARRRTAAIADRPARSRKPSTRARRVRAVGSVGNRVRLVLVDELEPVLDGTQPDVRLVELRARRRCVT